MTAGGVAVTALVIVVSSGWLARLLSGDPGGLAAEARVVERAGLESSPWQPSDPTGTRVDGEAWHGHGLDTPRFTAYHTLLRKDRLAVLAARRGGGCASGPSASARAVQPGPPRGTPC